MRKNIIYVMVYGMSLSLAYIFWWGKKLGYAWLQNAYKEL